MINAIRHTAPKSTRSLSPRLARICQVKAAASLTPAARLLLRSLIDYLADREVCWPSLTRLAAECGLSVRQVRRIIRQLAADGWLTITPRHRDDGGQTSSLISWGGPPAPPRTSASAPPRTSASALERASEEIQKEHAACGLETCDRMRPSDLPVPEPAPERVGKPLNVQICPFGSSPAPVPLTVPAPVAVASDTDSLTALPMSMAAILARRTPAVPEPAAAPENAQICAFTPEPERVANMNRGSYLAETSPEPAAPEDPLIKGSAPEPVPAKSAPAPAKSAPVPAPAKSGRWLTIQPERFDDALHAKEIYSAAVSCGLLTDSEQMRLSWLACWIAALARHRTGKVKSPAAVMRWLLQSPAVMAEYADQRSEDKARRLVARLW